VRETLVKLLGREPNLQECRAYLAYVRLLRTYPELKYILTVPESYEAGCSLE